MQISDIMFLVVRLMNWLSEHRAFHNSNISVWFLGFCFSFLYHSDYKYSYVAVGHTWKAYPEHNLKRIWATSQKIKRNKKQKCVHVEALIVESCGVYLESSSVCCSDFGSELFVQCLAWCKQNSNGGQKIISHIITFIVLIVTSQYFWFCF